MPSIGEQMTADPRTGDMPGNLKLVPTVWAQRASNAWYAALRVSNRVAVDGVAGQHTLDAVKDIQTRIMADMPAGTMVPTPAIVDTGHLAISTTLFNELTAGMRVADPAGSTVGLCNWDAVPRSSVAVNTSAGAATTSAPSDIPVEGSLTAYNTGLSVETVIVPAVAFAAAAALGFVLSRWAAPKRGRR